MPAAGCLLLSASRFLLSSFCFLLSAFRPLPTVFCLLLSLLPAGPPLQARELPPAVAPPQVVILPTPAIRTLGNGIEIVVVERHALPVVSLTLAVKTGAEADPPQLPGIAQLVASLLNEGTQNRSALQIAEQIDGAGGTIDTGANWDDSYATLSVLSDHTRLAFALLSDIAIRPAFAPAEVERIRRQTLSALDVLRDDPAYLADTFFEKAVFHGTPYSHPADGVESAVRRMTPEDLRRFHDCYYRPSNAALIVVGDVAANEAFSLARKFFGGWHPGGCSAPVPATGAGSRDQQRDHSHTSFSSAKAGGGNSSDSRQVIVIDDPNAVQTEIRIGNTAIRRASPAYDALTAANQILGGPAENLLFSALRSRRGLVYGASSDLLCYREAGAWEIKTSTRTAETVRTVQLILDVIKRLRDDAVQPEDLQMAQNYLIGHMALDFGTSQGIAQQILELLTYSLPSNYWSQFPGQIRGLSAEQLSQCIRRYLDPDAAAIVLVGNAAKFKKDLKKLGSVRVISLANMHLGSS